MSKFKLLLPHDVAPTLRFYLQLVGKKSIACALLAAFGSILVAGVEASVAVFLQFFLKALGLLPELTTSWSWLSNVTMSPTQLVLFLGAIGVLRGSMNVLVAQCIVVSNESMVAKMRLNLFRGLLLNEDAELIEASRLNFIVAEVIPKMGQFFGSLTQFITVVVLIIGVGAAMFVACWQHALIGITGLFSVGILVLRLNKLVLHSSVQLPIEQQNILSGLQRIARNWLLVRVLRTGKQEFNSLAIAIDSYYAAITRSSFWTYVGSESPPTFGIGILILIVYVQLSTNYASGGQFLAFLYLFVRFAQYCGSLARGAGTALSYFPSFKIGTTIFKNIIGPTFQRVSIPNKTLVTASHKKPNMGSAHAPDVLLRDVGFTYPSATHPVITGLNLTVKSGEHLGMVGQSGAGKTTVLSLLLGLLKPTVGEVLIDTLSPRQYFSAEKQVVGYVGPEPFLLRGTIRENLQYGLDDHATDNECWQALDQACIGDVLRKNQNGLDYPINENGDGLSAGQKQRLAIARALLRKPKLLVLDEASANVDETTEADLAKVISGLRGTTTCIIVSHRPGFLVHVDRTIALKANASIHLI